MANNDSENQNSQDEQAPKASALEWLTAVIGLILVVGSVGILIYDAVSEKNSPPKLIVNTESVTQTESGYLVKFSLYNDGEDNAADVTIEGKITEGEKDLEASSVTIGYSPSHSTRQGGLLFTKNPQQSDFQIRALGYNKP